MSDGGEAAAQRLEVALLENLGHKPHARVQAQALSVRGADPGAFLPTMLERVKPVEGESCDIQAGGKDAENSAGLSHLVAHGYLPRHRPETLPVPRPRGSGTALRVLNVTQGRSGSSANRREPYGAGAAQR